MESSGGIIEIKAGAYFDLFFVRTDNHYITINEEGKPLSRLSIEIPDRAQTVLNDLYRDMGRRISASQPGLCPVDMSLNFLRLCHAQTCGKCVPCRIGLGQLAVLIEQVLDRTATMETIDLIERTAQVIADSADCAIGYEAAHMVLRGGAGLPGGLRGARAPRPVHQRPEPPGALCLHLPGPCGHPRVHLPHPAGAV